MLSKSQTLDPASLPYATELITNRRGLVSKVVLRYRDYAALLAALEDAGLYRAMKETAREQPLDKERALALLNRK